MPLEDYSHHEIEANAHVPIQSSHHFHFPRQFDAKRIIQILDQENVGELEPGQNFGKFNLGIPPINTLK